MDAKTPPTSYIFRMDCWKPDTIPAKRLAEYMDKLATLFGEPEHVHFVRIAPGSTRQHFKVDEVRAERVYLRLVGAATGLPDPETTPVRNDINRMLIEDQGVGYLKVDKGARIIDFPGRKTPISEEVSIHEAGELVGRVVRVGGRGRNDKAIPITIAGDEFYPCRTTKETAKELAGCLFEGDVRVSGNGRWTRGIDGVWRLQMFDIKAFDKVADGQSLTAFVEDMRKIEGSGWNAAEDAQAELRKLREE